jgi:indolepyruvate ferredoxin oxidoreductase
MRSSIGEALGDGGGDFFDAQRIATRLMGDTIATNLFLLGFAWQKGLVPVSHDALQQAIELNDVAVEMNRQAFLWGRCAACDFEAVRRLAMPAEVTPIRPPSLDEIIDRRAAFLVGYQDAAYAQRYRALVEKVRVVEQHLGSSRLTETVARNYFKLLAYKDEYEVARLHADPAFREQINASFEGDFKINFHLAPPLLGRPDPMTGRIPKRVFGPYMLTLFRCLAPLRRFRGTPWDLFGHTAERRLERGLIRTYEEDIARLCHHCREFASAGFELAIKIAALPESIRGYGPVKRLAAVEAEKRRTALWRQLEAGLRDSEHSQGVAVAEPVRAV